MVNTFVKGAAIHVEYLTHKFDRILILICCYESNDCGYCSLANMAVAFFIFHFPVQVHVFSFGVFDIPS